MRQFFVTFSNQKVSPAATQLTWSHYTELLSVKDINELMYYINITVENNLSKRKLREKIKNHEYEKLPVSNRNKLMIKDSFEVKDFAPNPILIRNKNNIEIIIEKALHNLILEDIETFMKELAILLAS